MASPLTPRKRSSKLPSSNPHHRTRQRPSHNFTLEPSPDFFPSSKPELLRLLAVVAIAASVAVSVNFFVTHFNQKPKPFCDSITDFDYFHSDDCEPCPSNGVCNEGKLECVSGYRRHGKLCLEDGEVNEAARKLSKLVEVRLCEAYAQSLCSGSGTIWTSKDDIWNRLDAYKMMEIHGLDEPAYDYAKQRAMETIGRTMETRVHNLKVEEFKCPEALVEHYKPLSCRIQQWIFEHALVLMPVCASFVGCVLVLLRVRQKYYLSVRAEEIYEKVCDILEESATISRSVNDKGDPWVVASWLRDHLLLPKERKDRLLWKKVEELVQEDSRIDRYPKMVKGESKVVWEWQVEGRLSSSGKRKKANESKSDRINLSSSQQKVVVKAGEAIHC